MNRKVLKVVSILLVALMAVAVLTQGVFATDTTDYTKIDQFGGLSKDKQTAGVFQSFIATIINIAQVVGMGVAIIMLVVMAIKYISAAPSEKAELKKSITIYVVGAVVLFAATGILQVIKNFALANIQPSEATSMVVNLAKTYLG